MYIYNPNKRLGKIYVISLKILEKFLYLFNKKKLTQLEKVKKILIVKPDHIGDTIISTILFEPLKDNYREAKIDVICGSWGKNTYLNKKYINKIYELNHFFLDRSKEKNIIQKIAIFLVKYISIISKLNKERYDICIFLRAPIKGNLGSLMYLINAKYFIGFEGMGFEKNLNVKVKYDFKLHEKDNFLNLLKKIENFKLQEKKYSYIIPLPEDKELEKKARNLIKKDKKNIIINYMSGDKKRNLSRESIIKIIEKIGNENIDIYLITTENNLELNKEIVENYKKSKYNVKFLEKVDNIFKLGYFFKKMDMLITVDTSITHIGSVYIDEIEVIYYNDYGYINNPKRFYPYCKNYKNIISFTENINDINFDEI